MHVIIGTPQPMRLTNSTTMDTQKEYSARSKIAAQLTKMARNQGLHAMQASPRIKSAVADLIIRKTSQEGAAQ